MSYTAVLILGLAAVWLLQRVLTIRQALRFRRQLMKLRENGRLSIGMAKKVGRRVYVGLTFDTGGRVTASLVLSGATVFATGRPEPALVGLRAGDLAAGNTPSGLRPMVATAAVQSATFYRTPKSAAATAPPRKAVTTAA